MPLLEVESWEVENVGYVKLFNLYLNATINYLKLKLMEIT